MEWGGTTKRLNMAVVRHAMRLGSVLFSVLGAVVGFTLTACGSPAGPVTEARSLCQSAFGTKALNSAPGTVEDVRNLSIGPPPGYQPGSHAFRGTNGSQVIGWCWTGKPGDYEMYAVTSGFKPVKIEGLAGPLETKTPLPGPAAIP